MKYTPEQLNKMAHEFLKAQQTNNLDSRVSMLLVMLSVATGLSIEQCQVKIERLAY